ncbi:MAG: GldG family protein [Thermoanaerobaculales bacterium]|jgi:hypothetical protein|nr:GldG family protein [Thermoanaerobaculales bacterium]
MRSTSLKYGATGAIALILVIGLVLMANWLSARHYKHWDWTSTRLYSLSEKSLNLIDSLDQDVEVVVFMVPNSPMYDQVHELLTRYEASSSRISVEYIDPEKEPLRTTQLTQEYGVTMADTVVFIVGERTKYVTSEQMVEYDFAGMQYGQQQPTVKAFKAEEQFTSAILSLVATEVPKVGFVTGHGEATLTPAGSGALADRSLTMLANALRKENMETESVNLLSGEVPADVDVVVIAGPTTPYTEAEVAALNAYLDGGGRLVVALDPLIEADGTMRTTRLEALLAERGVIMGDDLVVDPSRKLPFFDLSAVYLMDFAAHPITQGLEGIAVLFTMTRSVRVDSDEAQVLVETSDEGWGETDLGMLLRGEPVVPDEAVDSMGPVAVAAVVEGAAAPATGVAGDVDGAEVVGEDSYRLAVFGDADFLTDVDAGNAGNLILAVNTLNWMTARELSMGIPPRDVQDLSFFIDQRQMMIIQIVVLLVIPGTAVAIGILVWRRRRH